MLMKKLTASLAMISFLLLLSPALATVSCSNCKVGSCTCTITDCDSGILDIFSASSCSITPTYEYTFSKGSLNWIPPTSRTYYVKALCSDGETQSDCIAVTVVSAQGATTTTTLKTTTTAPLPPAQGPDYTLFVLIAVLIVVILFAVWYLFLRKKKGGTYEEIYKKWKK